MLSGATNARFRLHIFLHREFFLNLPPGVEFHNFLKHLRECEFLNKMDLYWCFKVHTYETAFKLQIPILTIKILEVSQIIYIRGGQLHKVWKIFHHTISKLNGLLERNRLRVRPKNEKGKSSSSSPAIATRDRDGVRVFVTEAYHVSAEQLWHHMPQIFKKSQKGCISWALQ